VLSGIDFPVSPVMPGAGWRFAEAEVQPRRRRLDLAQHLKRRRHDFGTDTVTGEDGDVEGVVSAHWLSLDWQRHRNQR